MKPFTAAAIVIFSLVALAQLLRVNLGWNVMVNGVFIPFWISGIAFPSNHTRDHALARTLQ